MSSFRHPANNDCGQIDTHIAMAPPPTDVKLTGLQEAAHCHLMPCKIGATSTETAEAKAREYFWPTVRELKTFEENDDYDLGRAEPREIEQKAHDDDKEKPILVASFRGRPLQGRELPLPDGYIGYALATKKNNNTKSDRSFKSFTYWNWDSLPNKDDAVVKALRWLELSKAIHDPIE